MPKVDPKVAVAIAQDMLGLPQAVNRALQIIENPKFRINDLAQAISMDYALTAQILKWANSPFYNRRDGVATIDQAIVVLGSGTIRDLLLEASAGGMLSAEVPAYGFEDGALWRHSVAVAAGARWLALTQEYPNPSEVFVAGLLHDIGKLTFNELLARKRSLQREWAQQWQKGVTPNRLERWLIGYDHAQLGGVIIEMWNLPVVLRTATIYHHRPDLANGQTPGPPIAKWVNLANVTAHMLETGIVDESFDLNEQLNGQFGSSYLDLDMLIDVQQEAISEAGNLLK